MEPLRIGVVGVGGRGSSLLKTALTMSEIKVAAVADVARERVEVAAHQAGAAGHTSHVDLMDSGAVEAVIIGTPHPFHAAIAVDAARRGLHVLCEKPIAMEVSEADRMLQAARQAGIRLGIMFQRRLEPMHRQAYEIIRSGALGEIYDIEMLSTGWYRLQSYYDSGAWRGTWKGEGGGILANQSPHDLDLLGWLGGPATGLSATLRTRIHRIEVEDTVHAVLEYEGAKTGYYKATTADPLGRRSVEISGELGRLAIRDGKLLVCRYSRPLSEDILHSIDKQAFLAGWEEVPVAKGGNVTEGVIAQFVRAVREGAPLVATGEDGLRALELANAMHLSGLRHRPVALPLDRAEVGGLYADLIRSGGRPGILNGSGPVRAEVEAGA